VTENLLYVKAAAFPGRPVALSTYGGSTHTPHGITIEWPMGS